MELKRSIGTRYLYGFFDMGKKTLSKITLLFSSVPSQKNKKCLLNSEISKGFTSFNIFNIKTDCTCFVASPDIKNIGTRYRRNFIGGFPSLQKRSLSVPSTYRILGGIS